MTLDGKVAIITGASRGIGLAISKRLRQSGARVAMCARSLDALKQQEHSMGEDNALAVQMDIRDPNSIREGVNRIVDRFNSIHIVINNAGISGITPIDAPDPAAWLEIVQTNLVGSYLVTRACVPHMPDRGRVINISSVLGKFGVPGYTAYCSSKTALIGFTRALALELASRKITVNALCPGWVDTEMAWSGMRGIAAGMGIKPEEFYRQAMSNVPLGEMVQPEEVAETVLFLASEAAKNITAQAISVCGGSTQA
jgi:NAD(P)-dependent dehydrogenase (short-subunit alcohol dehydrogenase family)